MIRCWFHCTYSAGMHVFSCQLIRSSVSINLILLWYLFSTGIYALLMFNIGCYIEQDGQAMLWDLNEGKHLYTLDGGDVINSLCFSPNRYWLCAATGPSIKIWVIVHSNATTLHIYVYKLKEHLQGHINLISCSLYQRALISTKISNNIILNFQHSGNSDNDNFSNLIACPPDAWQTRN